MEINKKKINDFLLNLLNDVYETNSFVQNNSKDTKNLYQIYSDELKTAVNVSFDFLDSDIEDDLEIISLVTDKIQNLKTFESVLFVNYLDEEERIQNFIDELNKKTKLEIDFWDTYTVSSYLADFPKFLEQEDFSSKKLPFFLTKTTENKKNNDKLFDETHHNLNTFFKEGKKNICVLYNHLNGSGKTSAAIDFALKSKKIFSHSAYIKIRNDFRFDFIHNFINSEINFKYNNALNIYGNFKNLIATLNKIIGDKLLIFDSITNIEQIAIVKDLAQYSDFKIIIISQITIPDFFNVELKNFDKKAIQEIFKENLPDYKTDILSDVIEKCGNSPQLAHFIIKQINYHKKLTPEYVKELFVEKETKVHQFGKYINNELPQNWIITQKNIFKLIMALYENQVKDFTQNQKNLLTNLVCLPDLQYKINDLLEFLNIPNNKTDTIINELFELYNSGWIEVCDNNISVSKNILAILDKKLKPDTKSITNLLTFVNSKTYNQQITEESFNFLPFAFMLISNLQTADEVYVDLCENVANILNLMGYSEKSGFYYNLASDILEAIIEIRDINDYDFERLSNLNILGNDMEKALYYAQNNLEYKITKFGSKSVEAADAYKIMAIIYQNLEDYTKAIYYIEFALDIYEEFYPKDYPARQNAIKIHDKLSELESFNEAHINLNKFIDAFFKNNKK